MGCLITIEQEFDYNTRNTLPFEDMRIMSNKDIKRLSREYPNCSELEGCELNLSYCCIYQYAIYNYVECYTDKHRKFSRMCNICNKCMNHCWTYNALYNGISGFCEDYQRKIHITFRERACIECQTKNEI